MIVRFRKRAGVQRLRISIEDIVEVAAVAADDLRAENIVVLDLRGLSVMADYFVIADAPTDVQVRAVTNAIKDALEERDVPVLRREGWEDARWVLLDYGDVVVHIFHSEERDYYDLERLWGDAPRFGLNGEAGRLIPLGE